MCEASERHLASSGDGFAGGDPALFEPRQAGLLLTRVIPLPFEELTALGYESTGFRACGLHASTQELHQQRPFTLAGALCHVFAAPGHDVLAAFEIERSHDISALGFSREAVENDGKR